MKRLLILMGILLMSLPVKVAAKNRFYVSVGANNAIGDIDTSKDDANLISYGLPSLTPIDMGNSDFRLNFRLGYYIFDWLGLELEKHGAGFFWQDSAPYYDSGEYIGIITYSLDKKIRVHSLSSKIRFLETALKPYFIIGLGRMELNGAARGQLNEWDETNYIKETKTCSKIGLGLEYNVRQEETDRFSFFIEAAKWKGLGGDPDYGIKAISYISLVFGLHTAF